MSEALTRWRERCSLVLATGWVPLLERWPMPRLWREGVAIALTAAREAMDYEQAQVLVADALRAECMSFDQHYRSGIGKALLWLREEIDRG